MGRRRIRRVPDRSAILRRRAVDELFEKWQRLRRDISSKNEPPQAAHSDSDVLSRRLRHEVVAAQTTPEDVSDAHRIDILDKIALGDRNLDKHRK